MGAASLTSYGMVAAVQPTPTFGRVYATYGRFFIGLSLIWGVVVEWFRPDTYDVLGALMAVFGVLVIVVPYGG